MKSAFSGQSSSDENRPRPLKKRNPRIN